MSGGANVPQVGPSPVVVRQPYKPLTTFQIATSGTQATCTTGKECVPH